MVGIVPLRYSLVGRHIHPEVCTQGDRVGIVHPRVHREAYREVYRAIHHPMYTLVGTPLYIHPIPPWVYHSVHCTARLHSMYAGLRRVAGEEALGSKEERNHGYEAYSTLLAPKV